MSKKPENDPNSENQNDPVGYPSNPEREDIYNALNEEESIDPEDPSLEKTDNPEDDIAIRGIDPAETEMMEDDLDVPGADLDDEQEDIGSEDEENNYYSLGGDKDLEEEHPDDV